MLYFGYKKRWDKPKTFLECLNVPEELKPYVNDYKINLSEITYLTDEQVAMFKSDFRIVADYFVQMRKNNNYVPSPQKMHHVQATLNLLSVMTRDTRFEDAYNESEKGEAENMSEVLDRIEARGETRGILSSLKNLMANAKKTAEEAMALLGIPVDKRSTYAQLLQA